jgi:hypothetical protein
VCWSDVLVRRAAQTYCSDVLVRRAGQACRSGVLVRCALLGRGIDPLPLNGNIRRVARVGDMEELVTRANVRFVYECRLVLRVLTPSVVFVVVLFAI